MAQRSRAIERADAVRIQHQPLELRAIIGRPDLSVSEKESLLRREAPIDEGRFVASSFCKAR